MSPETEVADSNGPPLECNRTEVLTPHPGLPINVVSSITVQHPATIMKHYLSVTSADKFQALMAKMNFTDVAKQN